MRLLLLLALALSAAAAAGQPALTAPLDSLARAHAEAEGLPSLVVGVVAGGEHYVVGVGAVDSVGTAPDAHTLYEIGSISKVLTGLALADAVVRGEATLETPVADLLSDSLSVPEFEGAPIELGHLATHASGLPRLPLNLAFAPGFDIRDPYAQYDPDLLALFLRTQRLTAAPGTAFAYSNIGAGLLGYALAQRAGTDYAALVRQRVLTPLNMDETYALVPDAMAHRLATPHGQAGEPVPHWTWTEPTVGAGGWRSSADDLLTLAEAAIEPGSTPLAEAVALSLRPRFDVGDGRRVGLGWFFLPNPGGPDVAAHDGGTGGFVSFLAVVPEAGVGLVVLTNRQASVDAFALDLLTRLLRAE